MQTPFKGHGIYIWQLAKDRVSGPFLPESLDGMAYIKEFMQYMNLDYAMPKVGSGLLNFEAGVIRGAPTERQLHTFFDQMTAIGKPRIGWHYNYLADPASEARVAANLIYKFRLDGYVLDMEAEVKTAGYTKTRVFMGELKNRMPDIPLALSSYRFPTVHREFPWGAVLDSLFESKGDVHMPQVYWVGDSTPDGGANQLIRSYKELNALRRLPVIPTGPFYSQTVNLKRWSPTEYQALKFAEVARSLGCPGINWWSWDNLYITDVKGQPPGVHPQGYYPTLHKIGAYWKPINEPPTTPELSMEEKIAILWREAGDRAWDLTKK